MLFYFEIEDVPFLFIAPLSVPENILKNLIRLTVLTQVLYIKKISVTHFSRFKVTQISPGVILIIFNFVWSSVCGGNDNIF